MMPQPRATGGDDLKRPRIQIPLQVADLVQNDPHAPSSFHDPKINTILLVPQIFLVGEAGQCDNPTPSQGALVLVASDRPGRFDAVHDGHLHVRNEQIERTIRCMSRLEEVDRLEAILGLLEGDSLWSWRRPRLATRRRKRQRRPGVSRSRVCDLSRDMY